MDNPLIENLVLLEKININGGSNINYIFDNVDISKFLYLKGEISNDIYIFDENPATFTITKEVKMRNNKSYKIRKIETIHKYFASGSSNVVFGIKNIQTNENFLLKISCNELDTNYNILLKEKYIDDKRMYEGAIPEIYKIGVIIGTLNINNLTFYYHITKKYETNFESMEFYKKLDFFIKLTKILETIQNNEAYVKDLKIENIAYDENNNPVFIDYNSDTIEYYNEKQNFRGHTFLPYYAVKNYIENVKKSETYEKINIMGYVDILLNLFFEPYVFIENDKRMNVFLRCFYHKGILILHNGLEINTQNILNMSDTTYYETSLTGDISFLNIFVQNLKYKYNNTKDENYVCFYLKLMLFHSDNKGIFEGLMAPKYENIPTYEIFYDVLIKILNHLKKN